MKNRREFLKKSALALATTGVLAGVALAKEPQSKDLVKGKSKKKETLFQRSANWQQYYEKAE